MQEKILIVDDDISSLEAMQGYLESEGFSVVTASDPADVLERLEHVVVVVTDMKMPGMTGLELLKKIKEQHPEIPVIIITAYGEVDSAVESMKSGAVDYLNKPVDPDALAQKVRELYELNCDRVRNVRLQKELNREYGFDNIIGVSDAMRKVYQDMASAAPTDSTILITGETGSGKELVAEAIHRNSCRRDKPFVAFSAAELTANIVESELFGHKEGAFTGASRTHRGKFESADHGTLFIDEIGELDPSVQAKLLRVLEVGEVLPVGSDVPVRVDIRLVTATNRSIPEMLKNGTFRSDLYYRINVINISLPPLRQRREDIPLLCEYFVGRIAERLGREPVSIESDAMAALQAYPWPGNVRELRNVIERVVILLPKDAISAGDLPSEIYRKESSNGDSVFSVGMTMAELEQIAIQKTLEHVNGSRKKAAEILGISVRTLQRKLKEYTENE